MATPITLALDAMGGDDAPQMVIKGANIARERFPHVQFLMFGNKNTIEPLVNKYNGLSAVSEIIDTGEHVVTNEQTVSTALRNGKKTSMWKAIEAVKLGKADSVVSAGNTGVLMAMSKLLLRPLKGVHRPAICSFFPTRVGESVMLDLGANIECNADHLVQFGIMGEIFARTVLGLPNPSVGVLNVGSEDHKGKEYLKDAATKLKEGGKVNFFGFIEGDDIAKGTTDVVVTDGFTGNIALKTAEGVGALYGKFLSQTIRHSVFAKIGYMFSRSAFKKLRSRLDPRRYNGAVFLGLNGISIKSHGGTDALGFATAMGVAVNLTDHHFLEELSKQLTENEKDKELKVAASS